MEDRGRRRPRHPAHWLSVNRRLGSGANAGGRAQPAHRLLNLPHRLGADRAAGDEPVVPQVRQRPSALIVLASLGLIIAKAAGWTWTRRNHRNHGPPAV